MTVQSVVHKPDWSSRVCSCGASNALCMLYLYHSRCCRPAGQQRYCLCEKAPRGSGVCSAALTHFAPCACRIQSSSHRLLCLA